MDNTLQSIRYQRGSLQLLDQRKLPLETDYLNIRDATDGWSAVRDMVVRGAPAIAIAAALSVAVEVFNFDAFAGTAADAASLLENRLDYLVSRYALFFNFMLISLLLRLICILIFYLQSTNCSESF